MQGRLLSQMCDEKGRDIKATESCLNKGPGNKTSRHKVVVHLLAITSGNELGLLLYFLNLN